MLRVGPVCVGCAAVEHVLEAAHHAQLAEPTGPALEVVALPGRVRLLRHGRT